MPEHKQGFTAWGNRGYHMTFSNGWTVSVQWGPGNYCDHHNTYGFYAPKESDKWYSGTAEVAAWDRNGVWYQFDSDTVDGYKTPDEVAAFIAMIVGL